MSINEISLTDPTDSARPVVESLTLSVVGDLAFVSVCKVDEGNPDTTTTVVAHNLTSLRPRPER